MSREPNRSSGVAAFYVVTFAITHIVTTVYRLRGGSWHSLDTFLVANGIMLIPGATALAFTRFVSREPLATTLGLRVRPNRWWLLAWLAPPVLMVATLAVSLLLPGTSYDPTMGALGPRLIGPLWSVRVSAAACCCPPATTFERKVALPARP